MYKHIIICRVTCTKNETGKTTQKFRNMTIWSLIFDFCIQWSILWFTKWLKTEISLCGTLNTENGLNKFRTIVSEVSSFVGNPVYRHPGKCRVKGYLIIPCTFLPEEQTIQASIYFSLLWPLMGAKDVNFDYFFFLFATLHVILIKLYFRKYFSDLYSGYKLNSIVDINWTL